MGECLITSRKNRLLRHMKLLGSSSEYRAEQRQFFCDGLKLLEEAVKWGADIRQVVACSPPPFKLPPQAVLYLADRELVAFASPLKTPQPVIFSAGMPESGGEVDIKRSVILENLQDPGNVGTVMRAAGAFGIRNVILTGECADIYNPKAVRASMGAVFHQRTAYVELAELARLSKKTPVYGAALHRDSRDIRDVELADAAVAIGNEGAGLSEELLGLCAGTVVIPMTPGAESLNAAVAASVIMWEMARGRLPGQSKS